MKRKITFALGAFVVVLVGASVFRSGGVSLLSNVHAQGGGAQAQSPGAQVRKTCSLSTLRGEYLFTGRGDAAGYEHGPALPMVFAGVRTYDGQGRLSQVETISLGGKVRRSREEGVYTMDADCTGTMTVAGVRTFDMFVSRDGSEGVAVRTSDGSISTHTFKTR